MIVRQITENDAAAYIHFLQELDMETPFLLWERGERTLELENVQSRLRGADPMQRITLVAMEDSAVVGFLVGFRGIQRRVQHKADLTMGVLRSAWGRGIGTALIQAFEQWARGKGIWRLELTVMATNDRAVRLYEKEGFVREGMKRRSILVEGTAVDELVMGKILD